MFSSSEVCHTNSTGYLIYISTGDSNKKKLKIKTIKNYFIKILLEYDIWTSALKA